MRVCVQGSDGAPVWNFGDGYGETALSYLDDGTQERIIQVLLDAVAEARSQLSGPLQVANIVPYIRLATAKV